MKKYMCRFHALLLVLAALLRVQTPACATEASFQIPDLPDALAQGNAQLPCAGFVPENEDRSTILTSEGYPAATLTNDWGPDREEELYRVIEDGIREYVGIHFDPVENIVRPGDYIDLSQFGLSNTSAEDRTFVWTTFCRVFYDHPEFFFLQGDMYRYGPNGPLLGIIPRYYDFGSYYGIANEIDAMERCRMALNDAVERIVSKALEQTCEIGQLLVLHDGLADGLTYNWEIAEKLVLWEQYEGDPLNPDSPVRGAYSALVKKDSVCTGIARAFQLLVQRLDNPKIQCITVYNDTGSHVWNMVCVDGTWYHMDVNAAINNVPSTKGILRHGSFLISDEAMLNRGYLGKHTKASVGKNWEELPACDNTQYENGWAFNNVNYFMCPKSDGVFYYIKQNAVYVGQLSKAGDKLFDITFPKDASGVVWDHNNLYYIDENRQLIRCDLKERRQSVMGDIAFDALDPIAYTNRGDSTGSIYYIYDGIGLFRDKTTGEIVAVHRLDSEEINRYPPSSLKRVTGTCGDNLNWTFLGDGTLSVEGAGPMHNYNFDEKAGEVITPPWYLYRPYIRDLQINHGVETVGDWAFFSLNCLERVELPDSLNRIGPFAFYRCAQLGEIRIPEDVKTLPIYAFADCTALVHVKLPTAMESIGGRAFLNCERLQGITIPANVSRIEGLAFHNTGLTDVWFLGGGPGYIFVAENDSHSFDQVVTMHYLSGQDQWTNDRYYDSATHQWRGYALACWGVTDGTYWLGRQSNVYQAGVLQSTFSDDTTLILAGYANTGQMLGLVSQPPSGSASNNGTYAAHPLEGAVLSELSLPLDERISLSKLFMVDKNFQPLCPALTWK